MPTKRSKFSTEDQKEKNEDTREKFREKLRQGKFENKLVFIKVKQSKPNVLPIEIFSGSGLDDMDQNFQAILSSIIPQKEDKERKIPIKEARNIIREEEISKLIDMEKVVEEALKRTEEMGIVFLDEIDKIVSKENKSGPDVSREGVQRDILPIIEGSSVSTKYGVVSTEHILFIAAGAFNISKPSDLIPELQGRFPIRVELESLTRENLSQILTQPKNALVKQYKALLSTEDVEIDFTEDGVLEIASIAYEVNSKTENIGARRLHTIMEKLLEDISFNADSMRGQKIKMTKEYIIEKLADIVEDRDVSRYIL